MPLAPECFHRVQKPGGKDTPGEYPGFEYAARGKTWRVCRYTCYKVSSATRSEITCPASASRFLHRTAQVDDRHRIEITAVIFGDGEEIIGRHPVFGRIGAVLQVDQAEQAARPAARAVTTPAPSNSSGVNASPPGRGRAAFPGAVRATRRRYRGGPVSPALQPWRDQEVGHAADRIDRRVAQVDVAVAVEIDAILQDAARA
jgi:hypothetical protein